MSKIALVAAASVAVAAAAPLSESQYQSLFSRFVSQYEKQYNTNDFFAKFNTFKANLDAVMAHNAVGATYTKALNKFGDLTSEEFAATLGLRAVKAPVARAATTVELKRSSNASSIDWVKEGKVNPVKDQGQCGSCWAFSANAALETAVAIKTGKLLDLSEQELVDCSTSYGNAGCNGGLMTSAYEYTTDNGITVTSNYKYTARDGTCKSTGTSRDVKTTGYTNLATTEDALLAGLEKGVVAVAVDATALQFYSSGIISEGCSGGLNHGVALVAADTTSGVATVRNSWGTSWGEKGYYRYKIGVDALCVSAMTTLPKL